MEIKKAIWRIIEKYDDGDIDECIEEIESYLTNNDNVKLFKRYLDVDVFDSCGLDIYYISVSWIDINGNLDMCGSKLERY